MNSITGNGEQPIRSWASGGVPPLRKAGGLEEGPEEDEPHIASRASPPFQKIAHTTPRTAAWAVFRDRIDCARQTRPVMTREAKVTA